MRAAALAVLLAVPAGAQLSATPAACTSALIDAVSADLGEREARVKELAGRVRAEKSLFVAEARAAFVRPETHILETALGRDPFSFAVRLEALRPKLSEAEWSRGVSLWADWLEGAERAWERVDAADYCGLAAEGRSFAQDGYLMFLPFIAAAHGDDGLMPAFHLAAASGALSLGLDVVAFAPNVAMAAGKKLSRNVHIRRSAKAFRRFADFVAAREAALPPL
jgi:hypothetical protein